MHTITYCTLWIQHGRWCCVWPINTEPERCTPEGHTPEVLYNPKMYALTHSNSSLQPPLDAFIADAWHWELRLIHTHCTCTHTHTHQQSYFMKSSTNWRPNYKTGRDYKFYQALHIRKPNREHTIPTASRHLKGILICNCSYVPYIVALKIYS